MIYSGKMIVYNTTYTMPNQDARDFVIWVSQSMLPRVAENGILTAPRLLRILSHHDQETECFSLQFETESSIVFFLKDKYKKKKVIPYVETYSVKVNWPSEIIINIYEKKIMGCINDNGRYMYFDKDGIVVDISDKLLSTIPEVKGVKINNYVLHEKMKMPSDVVLPSVVEIKQQLDKYHMEVDSIVFDSDYAITLKKGDIKILLGKNKYLTEKIYEYSRIAPELVGRKGTLNLEACDGTKKSYPFKPSE